MFILNLLRLHIDGIPLWRLPSKDTLPVWLLRQLYTQGVKDWGRLTSSLSVSRAHYYVSGAIWTLAVFMATLLPCLVALIEFGEQPPEKVFEFAVLSFAFSFVPGLSYVILMFPDRQLSILSRLDRELRVIGGVFAGGLRSLNYESMTQEKFEDALDTEMNKLSAVVNQLTDEGKKYEARTTARRLKRLIRLSEELDFIDHHTTRYHELKNRAEAGMAV